jgi:hypothetical protein
MGRGMSGHSDSCRMRLWSQSGLLRLEKSTHEICKKKGGGGEGRNAAARKEYHEPSVAAWEEYHQPTTRWWRRRQPQVAGPSRSGVTRGARSVIATGRSKAAHKIGKKRGGGGV